MKKRKIVIALWTSVIFTCLTSGLLASIAWFQANSGFKVGVSGSIVEDYFHCGTGTEQDPFVITRPIHYYHLVEFYQRETPLAISQNEVADFGRDYLYFQVGYDLDDDPDTLEVYNYDDQGIFQGTDDVDLSYSQTLNMAYYSEANALLPIGTNEVPFIGSFNGNASEGITIANLNIHCSETVYVGNNQVVRSASDIGMFGYIADEDGNDNATVIHNLYVDGLTIDLTDVASEVADSSIIEVAHEDAHDGIAYVGYIAGHIHSYNNYEAVGPTNASPLYDVYVNNATVCGGPHVRCDYGYIGLVDSLDGDTPSIAEEVDVANEGQGSEWGGSINFRDMNARIFDLMPASGAPRTHKDSSNWYKVSASSYSNNPATNQVIYRLLNDTVLPLNVDHENGYATRASNTGYILAGGTGMSSRTIVCSSYPIRYINNSLTNTARTNNQIYNNTGVPTVAYNTDGSNLEVLTYNGSDFVRIKDEYNANYSSTNSTISGLTKSNSTTPASLNLAKYTSSRRHLHNILTKEVNSNVVSEEFIHGLHFMTTGISQGTYVTTGSGFNAYINGEGPLTSYQLVKNSIDFNLKSEGYINFFAGTYVADSTGKETDSFFSLYHVERNGNNISTVKEIEAIYSNTNYNPADVNSEKYVYKYKNVAKPSNASVNAVFDMSLFYDDPPASNAVYYFEVPVNKGEYAMGLCSGTSNGAYLFYLDISANGQNSSSIKIHDSPIFTQIDYKYDTYKINSCFNIAYVIPEGATKTTFSITISCDASYSYNDATYTCYQLTIINTTGHDLTLSALLSDDDDVFTNDYLYMYTITYNGGTTVEYLSSDIYTGESGATTMSAEYN